MIMHLFRVSDRPVSNGAIITYCKKQLEIPQSPKSVLPSYLHVCRTCLKNLALSASQGKVFAVAEQDNCQRDFICATASYETQLA